MPFKPPLPTDELRAMRERQPWNPDVIALLWEVKRLRATLLRLHQLRGNFPRPGGMMGQLHDDLMRQMDTEPCIIERDKVVKEVLYPPKT